MSTKNLITRWKSSAENNRAGERIFNIFKHGGVLNIDHTPFGRRDGDFLDFRGYSAQQILVKDVIIRDADLSFADFSSSWMETNHFENCLFEKTDFSDVADHGNIFSHCVFVKCNFKFAVLGYRGSQYQNCVFRECNFQRTNFIRAEFVETDFLNCRLKCIDFSGSSFENCKFEGVLEDVWFRGTYGYESYFTEFGRPKPNKMENVSFVNADLIDMTVSDGCDLSTVKLKNDGKYFKYDNWPERLHFLEREIGTWNNEHHKKEAQTFVKVGMVHAKKQDWKILNLDDLENYYGGVEVAHKIIDTLNSYS